MTKLLVFSIGAVILGGLCYRFGIDKVANWIQIISAVPWFWTVYRLEQIHKHHKKGENSNAK
jgi:hypothetical protein